jgi:hypothetical protein
VLPYCLMDSALGCFQLPPARQLAAGKWRVVVCSCATAGVLREGAYGAASPPLQFDFVMVDEAGQVGAAAAATAATAAALLLFGCCGYLELLCAYMTGDCADVGASCCRPWPQRLSSR